VHQCLASDKLVPQAFDCFESILSYLGTYHAFGKQYPDETAVPAFIKAFECADQLKQRVSSDGFQKDEATQILECIDHELTLHTRKPVATKLFSAKKDTSPEFLSSKFSSLSTACKSYAPCLNEV